jgi:hypothetical protein
MPAFSLDTADAIELAEFLQFLSDWVTAERDHLSGPLTRFTGSEAYGSDQLQADLDQFSFLLGGNDGEHLLLPGPQ